MKKVISFFEHNKLLPIAMLSIYFLILCIGLFNHEFWRDELQAWTIARDLSFVDIFRQMQYEGHPCLWHLILAIPAKLGFSPFAMGVISVLFMFVTALLVVYKSPFHFIVKLLLLCSSPFLYFFSIHSRVYSIIPFLICLLAIVYPKRMKKPILFAFLLALLTNTHIIMSFFVGVVSLFFFKDILSNEQYKNKKYWCALLVIIIGIIVLCLQIWNSLSINSIVKDLSVNDIYYYGNEFLNNFYRILYGFIGEINSFIGISIFNMKYICVIAIIILVIIIAMMIISFRHSIYSFIPFICIFLLHVFIWFSLPQRSVMLIILLMFAAWANYYDNKDKEKWKFILWEIIVSLFCIISIPYGIKSYVYDVENPVSGALATSEYIKENLEGAIFICPLDYVATSITGYIDEDIFYSNIRQDYFTFVNWDSYWRKEVTYEYFIESIQHFIDEHSQDVYIIFSKYFMWSYDVYIAYMMNDGIIEEIYKSPNGLVYETYWIYKFVDTN